MNFTSMPIIRLGRLRLAVLLASVALPTFAYSQQMYRCGNTYSQAPCSPQAEPKSVYQGAAPEKTAGLIGYELCAATAPSAVGSPEPESARVQPVGQRVAEVVQYAGQPLPAHRYDLSVDAKTQYGVYSGPVTYTCWVSEDQARILQFSRRRSKQ